MKNIKTYIVEKLKISKKQKTEYTLFPKTRDELEEMIYKEIEENGNECSLNHIDVSKITNLSGLFTFFKDFNGDISGWDVSNATKMDYMFYESKFNGNIYNWDVSNVIVTTMMFSGSEFNGDISEWDVSSVKNAAAMFSNCKFNQDISNWKTSSFVNMSQMFCNNKVFNQPIGKWDVSNVEFMNQTFYKAKSFNQDISNWKISTEALKQVNDVNKIFSECPIKEEYKPKIIQTLNKYKI